MAGELVDVIGGETILASFTNNVKDRTLMRYATATERDGLVPAPVAGDQAFLEDTNITTIFDGTGWVTVATNAEYSRIILHTDKATVSTGTLGEFAVPTGFSPTAQWCQGAQVGAPSVIVLQSRNSTEIIWRAYNAINGVAFGNTNIDVTYTVWGV